MSSKNIVCVNGYFLSKSKTGIGQYNLRILAGLIRNNAHNYIIYIPKLDSLEFNKLPIEIRESSLLIDLFYKRNDLLQQFIWESLYFPYFVKNHNFNLAWSPYQSLSIIKKTPHIMTVHDVIPNRMKEYIPNWKYGIYVNLLNRAIKKANRIITISKFCKKEISTVLRIKEEKIDIAYLASTKDLVKKKHKLKRKQDKFVLYLGGLDIRKNVVNLIKAFSSVSQKYTDLKLYIPGNYFEHPLIPDLPNLIKDCKLDKKVELLGYVDDKDIDYLLQNAEMLVYPSLYEGFGLPILEGWINDLPVITSDIGAMKEIAQDGALLINPNDVQSLSRGIVKILSNKDLKQRLILNGKKRLEYFTWEKTVTKTEKIFDKLLE